MEKVRIGFVGVGEFADFFIGLFQKHPLVEEVVLCDLVAQRRADAMKKFGIARSYASYEEMRKQAVRLVPNGKG